MTKANQDNIAIELIIAGIPGAVAKFKAAKLNVLEDYVLIPLFTHYRLYSSYADKSDSADAAQRFRLIANSCGYWHGYMQNVLNGLR